MRRTSSLLAVSLAATLVVAGPGLAGPDGEHRNNHRFAGQGLGPVPCGDDAWILVDGDATLWPPNHKYSPYEITGNTEDGGSGDDPVRVTSVVSHDEYMTPFVPNGEPDDSHEQDEQETNGAGNTTGDARPFFDSDSDGDPPTTFHEIRAERSGRGDGRSYTFHVWLTFNGTDGQTCYGSFDIEVPHSMGRSAENKRVHEPGS